MGTTLGSSGKNGCGSSLSIIMDREKLATVSAFFIFIGNNAIQAVSLLEGKTGLCHADRTDLLEVSDATLLTVVPETCPPAGRRHPTLLALWPPNQVVTWSFAGLLQFGSRGSRPWRT